MARKDVVDLFTPDKADNLRKELDSKIEQKVSNHVFYWVIALFVLVMGGAITYLIKLNDKADSINDRLIRVETKMEFQKS